MTPSNHRITRALALLMFAGAVTALAVPANAQTLDKALAVQGQADKAAADATAKAEKLTDDASRSADEGTAKAQADATKAVADAKRQADYLIDQAGQEARARREEAEAWHLRALEQFTRLDLRDRIGETGGWVVFGVVCALLPVVLYWIFAVHGR